MGFFLLFSLFPVLFYLINHFFCSADPPLLGSEPGRAVGPGLSEPWKGGDREKTPLYSLECLSFLAIPVQNPVDWAWDRFIRLQVQLGLYFSMYFCVFFTLLGFVVSEREKREEKEEKPRKITKPKLPFGALGMRGGKGQETRLRSDTGAPVAIGRLPVGQSSPRRGKIGKKGKLGSLSALF